MAAPFRSVKFGPVATQMKRLSEGEQLLQSAYALQSYPGRITEKLVFWANQAPERIFLARRHPLSGEWISLSYSQTLEKVLSLSQALLNLGLSSERPLVILSENSIEHGLLALAALHVGIPFSPISPAYSLLSSDFGKLKHILDLTTPGLVFAQSGTVYERALSLVKSSFPDAVLSTVEGAPEGLDSLSFSTLQHTVPTLEVEHAFERVNADTVAKILFTSGSTSQPKGVINTQRMLCSNLQQILQTFPFLADEPPVFVDWLPWNHTFGGNHNFGLTLYNGGTLYIDDGKPTANGIETTVKNLREIAPTLYFNVPKGFEELIPWFEREPDLRKTFFSRVKLLFYAGAGIPQPIWNRWEALAEETCGERIIITTGLGCTESGPSALFANWEGSYSGLLGVPVPGLELKLVPDGDKLEARYKGPNVTPGYWRQPEVTRSAFDEDGFYKTGDALRFVDESNPDEGMLFNGRIAEDFKLTTGTWVNAGILRAKLLAAGAPLVQDAVLSGTDRAYIGAILFLNLAACRALTGHSPDVPSHEIFTHSLVEKHLREILHELAKTATGSSSRIVRAVVALTPPSIDLGEITDKGSLNQRAVLKHRADLVEMLYSEPKAEAILELAN